MSSVVDFRAYVNAMRRHRQEPTQGLSGLYTVYGDLSDKRPPLHPEIKRTGDGRPILGVGQVWVEEGIERLWIIQEVTPARPSPAGEHITLRCYRIEKNVRLLCEASLRRTMLIWEDMARKKRGELFFPPAESPFLLGDDLFQFGRDE